MQTPWDHRYAQRTQRMKGSAIRELLKVTEMPDVISFGGGMPAPDVFPIEEFREACDKVLRNQGKQALQYGPTDGYLPLREMIAAYSARFGIEVTPENILITSGSQQALDLIGKIFINRGDRILVECPTYLGALQAWNAYGAEYVTVQSNENGMVLDQLESSMRSGPKFIYSLPNFQNPTGVTYSLECRQKLVEVADRYGVPIVEDDPYGQLRFEGENLPSIVNLDNKLRAQNGTYTGNVIYLSTFSKTLSPGIRLAWVIAPTEVIHKMVMAKQGTDLQTPTFTQIIAYEIIKNGFLDKHIQTIQNVYRERRDIMLEELQKNMPAGVQWTHPQGGLFLWVTLPEYMDSNVILKDAIAEKVAFVPGDCFFPNGGGQNTMRLNFSNAKPEKIREGIQRLGRVIQKYVK
ncbi:valine-pyruvate aminotransferase apoenzyme [Longilinea arvoryzae]|uniref:Valine-pyruvate aminotransferase apoenzyme n=1 Tax=Longilinea arvoryzae TaxID=360412 RepID=A0A0S7BJ04_9CHLR|nr:PLP-dependent aminotransferase family protein [Longilinea arvoryzae]GAP14438.1 valine-pyruvate aminotransferase apoenzyme [Longilinea arvoryzae]